MVGKFILYSKPRQRHEFEDDSFGIGVFSAKTFMLFFSFRGNIPTNPVSSPRKILH